MMTRILLTALISASFALSGCATLTRSMHKEPEEQKIVQKKPAPKKRATKKRAPRPETITKEYRDMLDEAQQALDEFVYETAALLSERVLKRYPKNDRAQHMNNVAHYQLAHFAREAGDPIEAIEHLEKVEPGYEDRDAMLAAIRTDTAEQYYLDGLAAYTAGDLQTATTFWEKALTLKPDHALARRDLNRTKDLLKKLDDLD